MAQEWPHPFPGTNWLDEAEEQAVLDVLRNGSLFRFYGPGKPTHAASLEARARQYYGVKHALAVSSCTGALMVSMRALGIGPGCEVILPAFLWVATVSAVVHAGAIPVLCEVDDSLNMDPADLARKITPRTRLIVVVHMAGAPCDMKSIQAVAAARGVDVLEDCAQCNGGSLGGRKVGSFGRAGVFSFQINKNVTAGEGGLIVTDDTDLYMRALAAHDLGIPWKDGAPDAEAGVNLWGQGRRMSELCGAVANVQLGKLPTVVQHMRRANRRIGRALEGMPGVGFRRLNDPDGDTGPFLAIILDNEDRAVRAAERIRAGGLANTWRVADYGLHVYSNIDSLVRKVPLSAAGEPWSLPQNAESIHDYAKGACPASDDLFARSVLITIPSRLSDEQADEMAAIVRDALSG